MIEVQGLELSQGSFRLSKISFSIANGKYGVLMGRTGAGKTSILEAICGLRRLNAGTICLCGADVTNSTPGERGIGYVPQDRALFNTMTVREHLGFSLAIRRWEKEEIAQRVGELAQLLGLQRILDRRPVGLSGGEAQRVALGRALAARPSVLCLDEPLSALDDQTRDEMYLLLEVVQETTGVTTLHVTHHLAEAERLGDVILLLKEGGIHCQPSGSF